MDLYRLINWFGETKVALDLEIQMRQSIYDMLSLFFVLRNSGSEADKCSVFLRKIFCVIYEGLVGLVDNNDSLVVRLLLSFLVADYCFDGTIESNHEGMEGLPLFFILLQQEWSLVDNDDLFNSVCLNLRHTKGGGHRNSSFTFCRRYNYHLVFLIGIS